MLSAICLNLDQSKILSSGNGLRNWKQTITLSLTLLQIFHALTTLKKKPLKTLWEKEKYTIPSIGSETESKLLSLTLLQMFQALTTLRKKPFENNMRKGENAVNRHFLLFCTNVFYSFRQKIHHLDHFQLFTKQLDFNPVQNARF